MSTICHDCSMDNIQLDENSKRNLDPNSEQYAQLNESDQIDRSTQVNLSKTNSHWKIILLASIIITLIGISTLIVRQNNTPKNNPLLSTSPMPSNQENIQNDQNYSNFSITGPSQKIENNNISKGIRLINQMKSSDDVPEKIQLEGKITFYLYHFKEEKKNPYCEDGDNSSTCLRQPVFGDYSEKSGFNCEGNIFFNPLNPEVNKLGMSYYEDEFHQTVPSIYDFYTIIKSSTYELFTGSTYEGFLLKRNDNTCHPYKLTFNYLQNGNPPTDRSRLSAVKFNVSDNKISSTNYSDYRFGCAGSSTRLVENNLDILNYLEKVTDLREGVALYTLKPVVNFDDKILKFNFSGSITSKILQDGGNAYLGDSKYSNEEKIEFINTLAKEKSLIFVQDSIFPNVIFVYSSFDNILYPGC